MHSCQLEKALLHYAARKMFTELPTDTSLQTFSKNVWYLTIMAPTLCKREYEVPASATCKKVNPKDWRVKVVSGKIVMKN